MASWWRPWCVATVWTRPDWTGAEPHLLPRRSSPGAAHHPAPVASRFPGRRPGSKAPPTRRGSSRRRPPRPEVRPRRRRPHRREPRRAGRPDGPRSRCPTRRWRYRAQTSAAGPDELLSWWSAGRPGCCSRRLTTKPGWPHTEAGWPHVRTRLSPTRWPSGFRWPAALRLVGPIDDGSRSAGSEWETG